MDKKKLLGVILAVGVLGGVLAGCSDTPTADEKQHNQQEKILEEGTRQTGMPKIINFNMRKQLKAIYEEVDQTNLVTYMYTYNDFTGLYMYKGEALGYPIPYATEYTNPEQIASSYQSGYAILPQADPDGLFHSPNTRADWIMKINPKDGKAYPAFCEPDIIVQPYKEPKENCDPKSLPANY